MSRTWCQPPLSTCWSPQTHTVNQQQHYNRQLLLKILPWHISPFSSSSQAHRSTLEEAPHHSSTRRKGHTSQEGKGGIRHRVPGYHPSPAGWACLAPSGRDFWAPARKPKQIRSFPLHGKFEEKNFPKRNEKAGHGINLYWVKETAVLHNQDISYDIWIMQHQTGNYGTMLAAFYHTTI